MTRIGRQSGRNISWQQKNKIFFKKVLTNQNFFDIILSVVEIIYGEMSERLKEPVLKTGDVRASVGSNPTLSSTFFINM